MALTVLIVDDHPSFRASARVLLEAEGFDVIGEAADGTSGIEEASRLRPDLVLLDVQLPDIDGFDVASRLTNGNGPAHRARLEPRLVGLRTARGPLRRPRASSRRPSSRAPASTSCSS